ncbi:AraC family transcriptional regulator [Chryseobacterium sp. T16E-39]|uniref:AraC family transcriptional regulator n=1 Tax=Chryseobacterium sp. T16E-39 TaxID=2015076 RepID=UPI000B5B37CE|nr:AraC family transcriptional regulator [Chryseobacterium sp. T16E-39]ASK28733.1 AraC family transcriptional regulator [Chryseobacterium sp. T16E-39]
MSNADHKDIDHRILEYATKVGLTTLDELQYVEVKLFKAFTFLPDIAMHFGTFNIKKNFIRKTATSSIKDSIGFLFYNIFDDDGTSSGTSTIKLPGDAPFVRIFPFTIQQKINFTKNTQATYVSISISADYLKSFLKEESPYFQFLFDDTNSFLIEELMTDDILRTVNDIVKKEAPDTMKSYYYKIKAMELLFYLFESLRKRESSVHQKLSGKEIKSIYQVRDKIVSSLSQPTSIAELKQIAGMNELKLRRIFTQVFGMGIYDYYQHLRMKEAARLLRDEKLSVSEAGYQMGFENLSHFSRVFEKHMGQKPKKYSNNLK